MFDKLFGRKKTIRVTFLDADTSDVIGNSEQPVDTIPDTFEVDTQLTIQERQYVVVNAEPALKKDFVASGKLSIWLRKVEYIDPKEVLMTLPTISDSLPPVGKIAFTGETYYNMHEDDWRQCEFISQLRLMEVEQECESIRRIYEHHRVPVASASFSAFNKLHVRQLENPFEGLTNPVHFSELRALLGTAGSLTFSTSGGKPYGFVTNGFSFTTGETVFYGQVDNKNTVVALGVRNPEEQLELCQQIKNRYSLLLIDWVNTRFL